MTDRDRLIELIDNFCKEELGTNLNKDILDKFADCLLANGVIVPPCKVGDTVWWVDKNRVLDMVCIGFVKTHKKLLVTIARNTNDFTTHYYVEWNVDIFLTKEEAEEKLKEREGE